MLLFSRTNLVNRERIAKVYENAWELTPKETQDDYGREYFDTWRETMETALVTARESVDQVVDTLENAVVRQSIESNYQVMKHIEKLRVWAWETIVPTPVTDFLMRSLLTDPNGTPARLAN